MKAGQYYKVGEIADKQINVNLLCLGIVPGKIIKVIRKAPFGGAWYVSCDGKRIGVSALEMDRLDLTEITVA